MSVRINISNVNGKVVYDDPNPTQSDLVFWRNGDSVAHWPIPFCSKLQVAPGATSGPYQAVPPFPTFPLKIQYGCAIPGHENESGTLTVQADVPAPAAVTPGGTPATKTITISTDGSFPEINVVQIDSVVWKNDDSKTHWPVPNCTGLKVEPGAVSNDMHPSPPPGPPTLPITVTYGCAIDGHQAERGTINVYNTFVLPAASITVSPTTPYAAVPVVTGGKSPYKINSGSLPSWLTLAETAPAGSSTGISIALNAPPQQTSVNYQLDVTDALGTQINQPITIAVAYGALTAVTPSATIFTQVKPYAAVPVATGGQSPYTMTADPAHPYISLVETAPIGSSTGVSAVLNSAPPATGPITYQLNIKDAAGNTLNTPITIILI